jgi:hypothetical protein
MESVGEILSNGWTGSARTYELVKSQIIDRFGLEAGDIYNPQENALTFREASRRGYRVKKGEKSLKSITFIEKDQPDGQKKRIPKTVHLFFLPVQCEKII